MIFVLRRRAEHRRGRGPFQMLRIGIGRKDGAWRFSIVWWVPKIQNFRIVTLPGIAPYFT